LDDLNWSKRGYNASEAYFTSKLANILHARKQGKLLADEGTQVTAVSVHPGFVRTNLTRFVMPKFVQNYILRPFYSCMGYVGNDDGWQTTLHTLLDDDVPNYSGEYFAQSGILFHNANSKSGGWPLQSSKPNAHDDTLAEELYIKSKELVGLE